MTEENRRIKAITRFHMVVEILSAVELWLLVEHGYFISTPHFVD